MATPVKTWANRMYKAVQIAKEPKIPIGMFRFGFLVSWAAVLTASKPINAKKTVPAAPTIPQKPPKLWFTPCSSVKIALGGM